MAIETLSLTSWTATPTLEIQQQAINALEDGKVVYIPDLAFHLQDHEKEFLSPHICDVRCKNVSYDLRCDNLSGINSGINKTAAEVLKLKSLMQRYALASQQLLRNIFPQYAPHAIHARTSFRPVEIDGRQAHSPRKDDKKLHVDAFPSTPTQGKRILRVFSNVNPHDKPRVWRVGEAFANVVNRYAPQAKPQFIGSAKLQQLLKITRGYRTLYDHYMLQMHDTMKGDQHYQVNVNQQEVRFPPGSTWFVYTDQVSHAAMAGQHVFEQTFYLPVHGQYKPETAPLSVLEKFLQKKLV